MISRYIKSPNICKCWSCHDSLCFRSPRVLVSMSGVSVQDCQIWDDQYLPHEFPNLASDSGFGPRSKRTHLSIPSSRVSAKTCRNTVQCVHRATRSSRTWIGARPRSPPTTISRWVGKQPLGWPATEEPAYRTRTSSKLQWLCMYTISRRICSRFPVPNRPGPPQGDRVTIARHYHRIMIMGRCPRPGTPIFTTCKESVYINQCDNIDIYI